MKILVTGGCGFIGSNFIRYFLQSNKNIEIYNFDKKTYAANKKTLQEFNSHPRYFFYDLDIANYEQLDSQITSILPDKLIHFAAESHVDRSINGPKDFINTNIVGTFNLLEVCRKLLNDKKINKNFLFHHISTDEVFGDLDLLGNDSFSEETSYDPSSPYSASKAASDHLVRSWSRTYGINHLITNCSNNFGPYQHPEKLIPKTIINVIQNKPIPIFGNGKQVRDWLHVSDHVCAIEQLINSKFMNETYNIGSNNQISNIDLVNQILEIMIKNFGFPSSIFDLIKYVEDRAGHDQRYAINSKKISTDLGWSAKLDSDLALKQTVKWYINNKSWWDDF
ncbi:dTDP-glucose 4,6-dehydratase [Gammaproteobacteria bacterium]|jgi:dTDP-glucose 4,6-dehydratase|nr:dTDP-glucose 4,6-dehydratase [Gammaproteobacteria bacterium]MDC0128997.1 dTDP-glucose 4,6-dehydratase [Gammaproteobacteria bacterium]